MQAYGGCAPVQWQYSDHLKYSTEYVDFNAFKGTPEQYKTSSTMDHWRHLWLRHSLLVPRLTLYGSGSRRSVAWNRDVIPAPLGKDGKPVSPNDKLWHAATTLRVNAKLNAICDKLGIDTTGIR